MPKEELGVKKMSLSRYRAWDSEANIMIYSDHRTRKLYDVYYGFEMNGEGELECRWEGEFTESHVLDGGTLDNLMQFTGIHDKNGKKIFEGDIVRYTWDMLTEKGKKVRISKVFWSDWRASWAVGKKPCDNDLFRYVRNGNTVEVIGNIYENPELLTMQEED